MLTAKQIADALAVAAAQAKAAPDVDPDDDYDVDLVWADIAEAEWYRVAVTPYGTTYESGAPGLTGILTVVYADTDVESWAPGNVEWAQYDCNAGVWEWDWPGI